MLKRFFLTIAILPIAMPLLWSDDKSSNRGKETPVLLNKNKTNQKPTDIQDDNLTCVYIEGQLQFQFAQSEGSASVDVSKLDTGERVTTQSNGYLFTVTMGDTPGFYQITVNTSEGSVYTGYLAID